ncbi:MAG: hemagglutinin [Pedobacter sp.]|nr:hemagglutinin [Pedobacter sp.]
MKYRILFLMALVVLSACKSRQYSRNNRKIEKTATKGKPDFTNYTSLSYIDKFKDVAIEEMNHNGIPASITLAQGLIESGSGNSGLAKYANNHFGVKVTSDWKGKGYYKDDDKRNDCFRVYADARESYKDHSEFLKRKRYSGLFELDKNDYKNWAYGLKQAGYATNPKYPEMLINLIEKYKLYQYDQSESEVQKLQREDRVFTQINANIPQEAKKFTPVEAPPSQKIITSSQVDSAVAAANATPMTALSDTRFHTVEKGDTLFNIAKKYNLTVEELQSINNLTDAGIKIGQKLQVVK